MGGGCKVFTVLCSLGKLADRTLSVYSVHVLKVMMKRGVVFNSDHLENSYNQSKRYGLVYWNSILPGKP